MDNALEGGRHSQVVSVLHDHLKRVSSSLLSTLDLRKPLSDVKEFVKHHLAGDLSISDPWLGPLSDALGRG